MSMTETEIVETEGSAAVAEELKTRGSFNLDRCCYDCKYVADDEHCCKVDCAGTYEKAYWVAREAQSPEKNVLTLTAACEPRDYIILRGNLEHVQAQVDSLQSEYRLLSVTSGNQGGIIVGMQRMVCGQEDNAND